MAALINKLKSEHGILFLSALSFFLLAFNKVAIYLPFFLVLIVCFFLMYNLRHVLSKNIKGLIYLSLIVFFVTVTFAIGLERMTVANPARSYINSLLVILFGVLAGGFFLMSMPYKIRIIILAMYILGLFIQSMSIVIYSFILDPVHYGYNFVITPFGGGIINSPSVSNLLAVVFSFFFYFLLYGKNKITIVVSYIIVVSSFIGAIYLGGRAFFIITACAILFYIVFHKNNNVLKILLYIALLFILITITTIIVFQGIDKDFVGFLTGRFLSIHNSRRIDLYVYGIIMIPNYPFGGFTVDQNIAPVASLHHFILDSARVAGWIPVIIFISALFYLGRKVFSIKHKTEYLLPICLIIVTLLLMSQDVVLEGNYRLLIVFTYASVILFSEKQNTNENMNISIEDSNK